MSDHPLVPHTYPDEPWSGMPSAAPDSCRALADLALTGAVVGGSAAAARSALRVQREELDFTQAIAATGRTAIASAVATAVAGAVAGAVARQGVLRLSLMFGVGAVALYTLSGWTGAEGDSHE